MALLIFFLLLTFWTVQSAERMKYIMGVPVYISSDSPELIEKAFRQFKKVDSYFSPYKKDSVLCRLNREKNITADSFFLQLLKLSVKLYRETEGYFDVSVGNLSLRYGSSYDNCFTVNSSSTGIENVVVEGSVVKLKNGISLDFGGIGKGFAVDLASDIFVQEGKEAVVRAGGDIRCTGSCFIAVENPLSSGFFATFWTKENNTGVSTSGIYRRFIKSWKNNHLKNPHTGKSGNTVLVSVFGREKNAVLDAYATAVSVMPVEKAVSFLNEKKLGFFMILPEGCFVSGRYNHLYVEKLKVSPEFVSCSSGQMFFENSEN
ncbi:FAD:protein FMN transferase [Persephonella sp.]